ncbi:alpha-fetoprotein-like isoform X5 [Balaenoptera musculus]|uniref:Alpha-fetoprotein-like isoform X5 n=1 Tax=Balaenoptera musculus TaxID=9771 RepID=A0A8B8XEQ8_BALMU|nr:alpha-fetoprotein-like isoform X5 [Balaenoptera musculus]
MKTVRTISFLVFFSYIKCQTLQRSLLDAAMQHTNSQNYLEENLRAVTSIMVAQFLQKLTYEKVQTIVKELLDLAEKCKSLKPHESPSECCHQLMTTFLEHICNNQGLADRHVFSDCCNTNNSARHKCFLSYKKDVAGYSDIFQISNPEQICEMDKENPVPVKEKYIYETSRKHPFLYGPTILTMSACYETAVQSCCREENKTECFQIKSQLMNYTCSKQATLSSKITPCCELPEPFRGECIINSENDKPDLSSLPLSRFTEDQFVCKQFTDKQDDILQEFLYEYSRRHPELAVPVILRVDTVYQNLLGKCCKLENPLECYSHGEEMFQRVVRESHEHVKNQCDLHEKLGASNFHDRLIVLYTKKAPQLSAQELVIFTKNMAAAATKCCPLNDEQQFACMENSAKLILGALCRRHEAEPINAGVGHCCDDSYAFRKPCFDDLQVDATYISPHLSCDQVVNLNEDLCRAQEEELQTEKQKLLSNLVKQEPYAAEMQFQSVIVDFAHLVEMCCQAEKSEMCLQEELSTSQKQQQKYETKGPFKTSGGGLPWWRSG